MGSMCLSLTSTLRQLKLFYTSTRLSARSLSEAEMNPGQISLII